MQLAIFDIDGTLTHSNEIDNRCFIQAFADEFGIVTSFDEWRACPHITDSGLTNFILSRHFGREPLAAESARIDTVRRDLLQTSHLVGLNEVFRVPSEAFAEHLHPK